MFEINNNTHQLWQWSTDQRLIVKNEYCGEVHFCNIDSASPIVRHVYDEDDCRFVDVPDELLTVSKTIKAYAYNFGGEFGGEQVFIVYPRPMPENYNATEADARGSALFSCRPETEGHIVIGEDRAVSVPEALRCIAVEHDHNIETVTFDCPRYWDGHDFSEMHVYINYRCANGKLGQYPCKTVTIDEADETIIHFDWTISRNLSCSKGVVSFLVCVKKTLDDGSVENHWSSRINQEMEVLEGLECPAEEIADYPDVIEQILLRLDDIEQNGGGSGDRYIPEAKVERVEGGVRVTITDKDGTTSEVVQDGKSGVHVGSDAPPAGTKVWVNPDGNRTEIPKVDDTLTKPGYAADAKAVGEKINQLSGDIDDKLDADKLPEAINIALTQAKESGEFKGDPGQPGKPGNDYVLTDADKTEIAEIAAGMVDIPEGGGGTSVKIDSTLTQAGKAADAKVVGDKLGEVSKAKADKSEIPIVADWALAELPFTEAQISNTVSGAGFVVNPTNFADGKTYFRYHAGASYGFRWTNPNPQKGSLTITMRGYSQYSETLSTKIVTVYTDGTDNSLTNMMYLKHGETVTYTTDPNKTVDYIRGNYDFEDWVLLDMDVLSIVADYPAPTGTVKTVNGVEPDENGNVDIDIPEGGGSGGTDIRENEKWEKIYEVTVSERVSYVEFNEDSEGNPFALRKMRAFLILPEWVSEDGETKGTGYAYYKINGKRPAYQTPSAGWDKATFIFEAEVYGDYYIAKAYKDGSQGASYTGFFHYDMFESAGSFDAINSFHWQTFNKDVMPNSKFIIYGVKV